MPLYVSIRPRSEPIPVDEEQLKNIFKKHDTNKDGRLDKKELKEAFEDLKSHNPGWRAGRALHHADDNNDGYITEEEMKDLLKYAVKIGYTLK